MSFQFGATLPTLEGQALRLRQLHDADVPALYSIFSDARVMRYWSCGPMTGIADAEYYLHEIKRGFAAGTLFQWGIARQTDDQVIGTCTLHDWHRAHARAEIGYALGADHWGAGHAIAALRRLFAFAFDSLALERLEADVDPRNERSIRMLERLGFQREGLMRQRYRINGEITDTAFFGLLRCEYAEAPNNRGND